MSSIIAIKNGAHHSRKDYKQSVANGRSFHLNVWRDAKFGHYIKVRSSISVVDGAIETDLVAFSLKMLEA